MAEQYAADYTGGDARKAIKVPYVHLCTSTAHKYPGDFMIT